MDIKTIVNHIKSTASLYGTVSNAGYKETDTGYRIKVDVTLKDNAGAAGGTDSEGYIKC